MGALIATVIPLAVFSMIGSVARAQPSVSVEVIITGIASVHATADDQETVLDFIRRYESSLASGRVDRIAELYAKFDDSRRGAVQDYFSQVISDLEIHLSGVTIDVEGDTARVGFDRSDLFTDRASGSRLAKSVALARHLERHDNQWRMVLE